MPRAARRPAPLDFSRIEWVWKKNHIFPSESYVEGKIQFWNVRIQNYGKGFGPRHNKSCFAWAIWRDMNGGQYRAEGREESFDLAYDVMLGVLEAMHRSQVAMHGNPWNPRHS